MPSPVNNNWTHSPRSLLEIGRLRDGRDYLVKKLRLDPAGNLRLSHHTQTRWQDPGLRATINTGHGRSGRIGSGFYASTLPAPGFGQHELVVEVPVEEFAGKQLLQLPRNAVDVLWHAGQYVHEQTPPGVDVVAAPGAHWHGQEAATWFMFPRDSGDWLNSVATTAEFTPIR